MTYVLWREMMKFNPKNPQARLASRGKVSLR